MPSPRPTRSPLAVAVGTRLRGLREARGLSASELARRSGLGKATLSELEAGRRNPTIETLYAITTVLEVPLSAALPPRDHPDAEDGAPIAGDAIRAVLVARFDDLTATTEVYRIAVEAGLQQQSAPHGNGVTEHWIVFAGELALGPHGEERTLGPGQTASFTADVPHAYRAGPDDVAATLIVRYPA